MRPYEFVQKRTNPSLPLRGRGTALCAVDEGIATSTRKRSEIFTHRKTHGYAQRVILQSLPPDREVARASETEGVPVLKQKLLSPRIRTHTVRPYQTLRLPTNSKIRTHSFPSGAARGAGDGAGRSGTDYGMLDAVCCDATNKQFRLSACAATSYEDRSIALSSLSLARVHLLGLEILFC